MRRFTGSETRENEVKDWGKTSAVGAEGSGTLFQNEKKKTKENKKKNNLRSSCFFADEDT